MGDATGRRLTPDGFPPGTVFIGGGPESMFVDEYRIEAWSLSGAFVKMSPGGWVFAGARVCREWLGWLPDPAQVEPTP